MSDALAILDGLPNIRNTRDARVLEKQLRILLFVAFAAKQFKSSEIVARLLQEVLNVRKAISQPAGSFTSNLPPMSSEDLCAMIFRMLYSECRLVNQMVLNHYKETEQIEQYQCCQRQNENMKRVQALMEAKFNAAFKTADLVTLEQMVRGALEVLNVKTLCNDQATIEDPNLVARIQKLASRITGSIYYLKNHERAVQQIQTAYERGNAMRDVDRSDASLSQSRPERTPAEQQQWQELNAGVFENLRRQAEVGQERAKRAVGGNESRIQQPNRSVRARTPDEQQQWDDRQHVQDEHIRQYAQKGQDRVRRINEGSVSRLPQPNRSERARTPEELQEWEYRQQLQNDNIQKYAVLGQKRKQRVVDGPEYSAVRLNQSVRGRTPEEQQQWKKLKMQHAASIRRDAEKGQRRARQLEANASQSFADTSTQHVRRKTPEEQRKSNIFRQRNDERIRLEEEWGREKVRAINEGPRPATPNVSQIERTPAQQRRWEQTKREHAESIRWNAELGQKRKQQYEQGTDDTANNSTVQVRRRRTPEERERDDNFQERYAENIRMNEEHGRERRRLIEQGPDARRPMHNQSVRSRTPAEQREWQELQRRQAMDIQYKGELGRDKLARVGQGTVQRMPGANQTQRELTAEERRQWQALSQRTDANIKKSAARGQERVVQYTQQVQTITRSESFVR